jgi:zinc protease
VRWWLLLVLVACGAAPRAIDWTKPPAPQAAARFVAPAIDSFVLRSGVRVILVENHRLPIATLLAINHGAGSRGAAPGLAALTASLLADGAGPLDRDAFASALESQGATVDIDIASDHTTLTVSALADHLADAIHLLAEALRRPRFDEVDLAQARSERAAELAMHAGQLRIVAAQRFDRLVFGDHPYGRAAEGDLAMAAYGPGEVRAAWARAYGPTTTTLIVVGAVARTSLRPVLEAAFGDWTNPPPPPTASPTAAQSPALAYLDRPGDEVAIVIGRRIAPPNPAQRLAADLANAALGGIDGPLQRSVGVGIAIGASFWRGELGGTWSVATTVKLEAAAPAIRAILGTIEQARTAGPTDAELALARAQLLRALPAAFETNTGVAHALQRLVVQGLPLDHYATYTDDLAAITPAEARAAIAPLWTGLSIVVVGDWSRLGPALSELGLPSIMK